MDFVDDGRLADAGLTGNEHQQRSTARGPLKRRQQPVDLAVASVEFLRDLEASRHIAVAESKVEDRA